MNLNLLLSALAEDPSDRGLRDVVSDAMEECGRTEEAELLRSDKTIAVTDDRIEETIDIHLMFRGFLEAHNSRMIQEMAHITAIAGERLESGDLVSLDDQGRARRYRADEGKPPAGVVP